MIRVIHSCQATLAGSSESIGTVKVDSLNRDSTRLRLGLGPGQALARRRRAAPTAAERSRYASNPIAVIRVGWTHPGPSGPILSRARVAGPGTAGRPGSPSPASGPVATGLVGRSLGPAAPIRSCPSHGHGHIISESVSFRAGPGPGRSISRCQWHRGWPGCGGGEPAGPPWP